MSELTMSNLKGFFRANTNMANFINITGILVGIGAIVLGVFSIIDAIKSEDEAKKKLK